MEELFGVERRGDTLVVATGPQLSEYDYQRLEQEGQKLLHVLDQSGSKHVVLDLHQTIYFTSSALGWFLKLWKAIRGVDGRLLLCGVSENVMEILKVTQLDRMWPVYESRDDALAALAAQAPG